MHNGEFIHVYLLSLLSNRNYLLCIMVKISLLDNYIYIISVIIYNTNVPVEMEGSDL